MESTRAITVVYTVLELGPFKHLMEETGFSKRNCYLKCLNWVCSVKDVLISKISVGILYIFKR